MGLSPAIFESAGQRTEHYVPGVYSRSNNVSSPSGVSAGNHVILAKSTGGKPFELLSFGSLSEAKEQLVGGDLLKAIGYAFKASTTYIPSVVYAMRVGQATQSEATLASGGLSILKLKSWDYGVHTNQLKIKVESGDVDGSKTIYIVYKDNEVVLENLIRESISIVYTGEGTNPRASITTTGITMSATQTVEEEEETIDEFSCTWEDATTLEELETRINNSGVYTCAVVDSITDRPTKELDTISSIDISVNAVFYSNLQAVIEALENVSYIGSVELLSQSSRIVPENNMNYVYFTGGTATAPTTQDWADALEVLETKNIQIISTPSTDTSVQALISAHCLSMSNTINRKERTCIVGAAIGESDTNGLSAAKGFNSKYVSYVLDSAFAQDPLTGDTETISGAMVGVMLAAMESAMAINEPLTFKALNVLGFTAERTIPNMTKLIAGGILVCNADPENPNNNICIRAITTFQGNNDLISCERSMVREDLYMNKDLRNRFTGGVGHPNKANESDVLSVLEKAAKEWGVAGYILKVNGKYISNASVRFSGDKTYLTYERYLTAPSNFVFITATNRSYESTIEV